MRQIVLVAALGLAATARLTAQNTEIGFDAVADFQIDDESGDKYDQIVLLGGGGFLPTAGFRVAFPLGGVSLEPAIGFTRFSEGDASFKMAQGMVGLLLEKRNPSGGTNFFLRPFGLVDWSKSEVADVSDSDTQYGLGVGIGVRFPMDDRLSVRLEGNYAHRFERESEGLPKRDVIGIRLGMSMFLRPKM